MPELPEVEQVARELRAPLLGRHLVGLVHAHPDVLRYGRGLDARSFAGRPFTEIRRRGKLLLFALGDDLVLTLHLRMTGRLSVEPKAVARLAHSHLIWSLEGEDELRLVDTRRFGRAQLLRMEELESDPFLNRLGPEPFDLKLHDLQERLSSRRGTLKGALLDQSLVAGLGNIYVDEILHRARLHPLLISATVRADESARLRDSMRSVIGEAIAAGGSTIRDYLRPSGRFGEYQRLHRVFDREGESCNSCGTLVLKTVVVGRGTYYCPKCQPKRRRRVPSTRPKRRPVGKRT